ncbi:choice-of-anchor D domain-containing protein [Catalinimonas alkaloidigena]|nr:choice-of-anchor D domain-containing protein [Catalinimonas alkaloidigena]
MKQNVCFALAFCAGIIPSVRGQATTADPSVVRSALAAQAVYIEAEPAVRATPDAFPVEGNALAAPALQWPTADFIFSGVRSTTSSSQQVVLKNTGDGPLQLSKIALESGSDFRVTQVPSLPYTLAAGEQLVLQVAFTPKKVGSLSDRLQVSSNDPAQPLANVYLYGLGTAGEQGGKEPSLHNIVTTLGYKIDVGGTALILETGPSAIGDEVLEPLFEKAADGPVTIKPVARYSPDDLLDYGYYLPGTTPTPKKVNTIALDQEQTLMPAVLTDAFTFEPGKAAFGFYVGATSYAGYNTYTEDKLNTTSPLSHSVRIYPLKNREGVAVPHSYLVAMEPAANGDYQDYVFVVANVKPYRENTEPTPPPPAPDGGLMTKLASTSSLKYEEAVLNVGVQHYTDRDRHAVTSLPEALKGAEFVKTANDDKNSSDAALISFTLTAKATVYVAYDPRGWRLPAWLNNWEKVTERLGTTDPSINAFDLYKQTFPAGTVTLGGNLASPAQGARTNYLVAAIPAEDVVEPEPQPSLYEAENAQVVGGTVSSKHAGYSGEGFVDYLHASNDYIAWEVERAAAGTYQLAFRYAHGGSDTRAMRLVVNGTVVTGSLAFEPTGDWGLWTKISLNAPLNKGKNTIQLVAAGRSGPNVDYLEVTVPGEARVLPQTAVAASVPATMDVYPNPAAQAVTLTFATEQAEAVDVQLINARGQQVMQQQYQATQGLNQLQLPVATLKNGMYVLLLRSQAGVQTKRIIISR